MNKSEIFVSIIFAGIIVFTGLAGCAAVKAPSPAKELNIFAGSASKPALDEIAARFEKETGAKVYLTYGGSGSVLSQMKLSKTGDIYIPGSPDYMAKAERDGVIEQCSVKIISYLVPVIAVQYGNPKNIRSLSDMAKPGIRVAIGDPDTVCVGLYAVEIFEYNKVINTLSKNIVTYADSCESTAALLALKSVDAVIGWHVFHNWNPDNIDIINLKPEQLPRLAYIPAAVSVYSGESQTARSFVEFLTAPSSQDIFKQNGYYTTESEVRKFAPAAQIGGIYNLPADYKPLVH